MIIDTHTHAWPDKVALKAKEHLEEVFQLKVPVEPTVTNLLRSMDTAGVDVSFIAAVASRPEQVPGINAWLRTIVSDRLKALAAFHPFRAEWKDDLARIREFASGIKLQPEFQDFYIEKDIIFIHGHKEFLEIYDKTLNLIVMAHLHPTITLQDKLKIKREKYKCFLQGKFKNKQVIILPSFLSITEGVSSDEFLEFEIDFLIIPQTELFKFKVFASQPPGENALDFGILGKMN